MFEKGFLIIWKFKTTVKVFSFDESFENHKPALKMKGFIKNKDVIVKKNSSYKTNYYVFICISGLAQYKYVTSPGNNEPRYDSKENGKQCIYLPSEKIPIWLIVYLDRITI